ncbi:hypothetical protein SEA_ILLUMINE_86 [Mycobacterium phage Illumine]|nr:hypothetical protein SEA_DOLE_85 [Mycobacterium phage Dole]UDL14759.1 hypothetical protein SEA_DEVERA_88 [Mycobacterium phage Devera]UDL15022.1 hypothetical protein SEA_ILLUMINE_86 [Mycobacterium phage Illumine]
MRNRRVYRLRRPELPREWWFVGVRWVVEGWDDARRQWVEAYASSALHEPVAYWWAWTAGGGREPMYATPGDRGVTLYELRQC